MSQFMPNQAAAHGGSARGFEQGTDTTTCTVYSSDWIIAKATGTDYVFANSELTQKSRNKMVPYPQGRLPVSGTQFSVGPSDDKLVEIRLPVYKPRNDYHDRATGLKNSWGTTGHTLLPAEKKYIAEQCRLELDDGEDDATFFNVGGQFGDQEKTELLPYLQETGFRLWTTGPHAIASWTTPTHFWIFDPLVGEASVPLTNLEAWFGTQAVKDFFRGPDRQRFISARRLAAAAGT